MSAEVERAYDALVEHAARYWSAEEENARRRAARVNLLLTVGVAVIGLGLYKLGTDLLTLRTDPTWVRWSYVVPIVAGLIFFLISAWFLLHVRIGTGQRGPEGNERDLAEMLRDYVLDASFELRIAPETYLGLYSRIPDPERDAAGWTKMHTFLRTYRAAESLTERNAHEERRINAGQITLFVGFALIVVALAVYTVSSGMGLVSSP